MISFRFKKAERLRSKAIIDQLFKNGRSLFKHPIKFLYLPTVLPSEERVQVAISVPKRLHKKAYVRNLIKRRMKEAYRKHKIIAHDTNESFSNQYACMYIYIGKDICDYHIIEKAITHINKEALKRFS